jgi:hypothetical protein
VIGLKESVASKTAHNNVYGQLLGYRLLGNSFGISSGSFLFTNLVLANATNHKQTRCGTLRQNIFINSKTQPQYLWESISKAN